MTDVRRTSARTLVPMAVHAHSNSPWTQALNFKATSGALANQCCCLTWKLAGSFCMRWLGASKAACFLQSRSEFKWSCMSRSCWHFRDAGVYAPNFHVFCSGSQKKHFPDPEHVSLRALLLLHPRLTSSCNIICNVRNTAFKWLLLVCLGAIQSKNC